MAVNMNLAEASTIKTERQLCSSQASNDSSSEEMELSFQESMQAFKEKALDQIKNGEPAYQIGGSELSLKEWDKLIDKVDKSINSIKEEQKERLEKEEEDRNEKELLETTNEEKAEQREVDQSTVDKLFQESLIL